MTSCVGGEYKPEWSAETDSVLRDMKSDHLVDDNVVCKSMDIFYDDRLSCECCDVFLSLCYDSSVSFDVKLDYNLLCITAQCLPMTISSVLLIYDALHCLLAESTKESLNKRRVSYWHVFYHFFFNECYEESIGEQRCLVTATTNTAGNQEEAEEEDDEDMAVVDMETRRLVNLLFHHIHQLMRLNETLRHPATLPTRVDMEAFIDDSLRKLIKHGIFNTRTRCCNQKTKRVQCHKPAGSPALHTQEVDRCDRMSSFVRDKLLTITSMTKPSAGKGKHAKNVLQHRANAISLRVLDYLSSASGRRDTPSSISKRKSKKKIRKTKQGHGFTVSDVSLFR